ncbi:hypothetical protein D7X94_14525 [Acutalibacter sp. 1XD8-33]|nr:hypothetical protein D7X94_14525 [Acutalibacter sp. 1XD8-33]
MKTPSPYCFEGLYLRRRYGPLAVYFGLFLPADYFPGLGSALKLCRLLVQLPLYSFAAPPLGRVPACGEIALFPAPANPDFVEQSAVFFHVGFLLLYDLLAFCKTYNFCLRLSFAWAITKEQGERL